jgi:methylated-DNA-[protein]-cysteine S-methyltransferase
MPTDVRVLKVSQPTAFQQRVFDVVCRIPEGFISTYGEVAKAIDCGSSRAIGQALRRHPFSEDAPCHRVIAGDLSIGGYGDHEHKDFVRKRRLLEQEGVAFDDEWRVKPEHLITASKLKIPSQSRRKATTKATS